MNKRSVYIRIIMALAFWLCITLELRGMMSDVMSCSTEKCEDVKKVALTFDDGPNEVYTPILLDGLQKRGARASFFVLGEHAEQFPGIIERMQKEGHLIGNHTYSHMQLGMDNREQYKAELIKTSELIQSITGKEVNYVRPPYGSWDKSFEKELNMFPVLWNIDPVDWCSTDAECIARKVVKNTKENAIILMHDNYKSSVEAALQVVDILQKQGYHFVTVDELLFD